MFILFKVFLHGCCSLTIQIKIILVKWLQKHFFNVLITITQPTMEESKFDIVASVKQCMLLNIMLRVSLDHLRAVQRLMVHFTTNVKSVLSENLGCILGGTQCSMGD